MLAVHRFCLGSSLLVLCVAGCDRSQPVAPAVPAASTGAGSPAVKAPSNTNAVAVSESRIDVSWRDNSSNETGFEVHRSTAGASGAFALLVSTGAGVTSYRDAGLTPSRQYCYKVRAFKRADGKTSYSSFANTACATTPVPPAPAAPSGADAKPATSTTADVRWIDNATNEDGFRVQRAPNVSSPLDDRRDGGTERHLLIGRGPRERAAGVLSRHRVQRRGRLPAVERRLHGASHGSHGPDGDGDGRAGRGSRLGGQLRCRGRL